MAGLQTDTDALAAIAHAEKSHTRGSDSLYDNKGDAEAPVQDGIHDGLEFPTEEEKKTLRRVADTIPWNVYRQWLAITRPSGICSSSRLLVVAFIELVERFSYYGTTVVFTNFIQQPLPEGSRTGAGGRDGQSGALGKGQQASTGKSRPEANISLSLTRIVSRPHHIQLVLVRLRSAFNYYSCVTDFRVYVIPLFGAYIADTYWGRYKTICVSVAIALFGHVLLIISAVPGVIDHPDGALACFVIALIVMGLGTGGFKANISPLVAEQYKKTKMFTRYTKSGEKVVVDPSLTISSIYMVVPVT